VPTLVDVTQPQALHLRPGEMVVVRSEAEIRATIDADGRLDGLPFMPEMLAHCGRTFRVFRRADKTCDTFGSTGMRRLHDTVHLEMLRCDGSAHGGCQAECLVYWKEAWLARVSGRESDATPAEGATPAEEATPAHPIRDQAIGPDPGTLIQLTRRRTATSQDEERYYCQATELQSASTALPWWEPSQYVRDVRSGNVGVREVVAGLVRFGYSKFQQRFINGSPIPFMRGRQTKTPTEVLDLRPGEIVRVKSKRAIEATLDRGNRNRGLLFDSEMLPYCGREFAVHRRVEQIINEQTGEMLRLRGDCVMLESVACMSLYHRFCQRRIYSYWREIWLTRVETPQPAEGADGTPAEAAAVPMQRH
jgi:hypothetical protein